MAGRYLPAAPFGIQVEKPSLSRSRKIAAQKSRMPRHSGIVKTLAKLLLVAVSLVVASPATASLESRQQAISDGGVLAQELGDSIVGSSLARLRFQKARADKDRFLGDDGIVVTAAQLEGFLARKASPMLPFVGEILSASNRYGVDPRLVVAIAGVESDFGRVCKGFNAWGWNNGRTRWLSWAHSIDSYTRSISERYPNWRNVPGMARSYNPNTPSAWARKVRAFMEAIGSSRT
jgi:hypothetical protein